MKYTDENKPQENTSHFEKGNKKKGFVFLLTALFMLMVTVGTTLAFVAMQSSQVTNTFTPAKVASQVTENFDEKTKTDVRIENIGNTEAYIRAAIVVTWRETATGNMSAIKPVAGKDYTITLNDTDWFLNSADGFYYHKAPVDYNGTNKETSVLIYSCAPVAGRAPEGFELSVEIVASAIQSNPTTVAEEQWGVEVDTVNGNVLMQKSGS